MSTLVPFSLRKAHASQRMPLRKERTRQRIPESEQLW
jgi:hypothetical protein